MNRPNNKRPDKKKKRNRPRRLNPLSAHGKTRKYPFRLPDDFSGPLLAGSDLEEAALSVMARVALDDAILGLSSKERMVCALLIKASKEIIRKMAKAGDPAEKPEGLVQ